MRLTFTLLLWLLGYSLWSQNAEIANGIGAFAPFDRLIICPPSHSTAMPFLGLGRNCVLRSFNRINVVAPEMDAIINSDQNPALLHQPSAYQAVKVDYTPWQADFNSANTYAFKASIQKQFRPGSSWDLRYENFSVAPSLDFSKNSTASFSPNLQVLRLAYANTISEHWSLGVAAKYAKQKTKKEFGFSRSIKRAVAVAADLGLKYQNSKALSESQQLAWQWGFSLSNLGPKVESEAENSFRHPLPTMLSTGFLLEQTTQLGNTASLRIRGAYQLNKLLTPNFCEDCDDNLNSVPDYLEHSAFGGMIASFTDASDGLIGELREINHQLDMGAVYNFNATFGLRSQLTLFYQNPDKGAVQYLATQLGMQWGEMQFDFVYYTPFNQSGESKLGVSLGYLHFFNPT